MLVAVALALVGLNVVLARWSVPAAPSEHGGRIAALVAGTWLALGLLPVHDLSRRAADAAVTGIDAQTGVELLVFGAAGALAVHLLRTLVRPVPIGTGLLVLPVWVLASAAWADAPAYALARGLEYLALAALAVATAGLVAVRPVLLERVGELFLRWTAWTTLLLIALGVALGPLFVVVLASNADRFTWAGAHPTESGYVLGVACIVLLGAPARVLRMGPLARALALGIVAAALQQNQSRTVLAAVAAGVLVLLWLWRRADPVRTEAVGFALGAGAVAGGLLAGGAIWSYVLRGEGTERLTTLNGRTDLWDIGLDALGGPMDWVHGLGFGVTRVLFLDEAAFAGNAHNSLLGTLVSLGLVGVALLVAALWRVAVDLHRSGGATTPSGRLFAALVTYAVVAAVAADDLAEPHLGLITLYLAGALAAGWLAARRLDAGPHDPGSSVVPSRQGTTTHPTEAR